MVFEKQMDDSEGEGEGETRRSSRVAGLKDRDVVHMHKGECGVLKQPEIRERTIVMKSRASDKYIHLDPVPDFHDRSEIKPWLQKIFYPQGVELAIERSDNIKVVFKCKAAKRGKAHKGDRMGEENNNFRSLEKVEEYPGYGIPTVAGPKKKRSVSRFNLCPFRIRATYSVKRERWNIVIINNNHSHKLGFNADSEEYKKFKEKLKKDGDLEAVKKFDELEYRIKADLPINQSVLPCDCGLTSEIESFNVVLPTAASHSSTNLVTKPKSSKTKLKMVPSKTAILQNTSEDDLRSNSSINFKSHTDLKKASTDNVLESTFLDEFENDGVTNNVLTMSSITTDLNEIDFTKIFTKPTYHKTQHNNLHSLNTPGITLKDTESSKLNSSSNQALFLQFNEDDLLIENPENSNFLEYPFLNKYDHSSEALVNPLSTDDGLDFSLGYGKISEPVQTRSNFNLCQNTNSNVCYCNNCSKTGNFLQESDDAKALNTLETDTPLISRLDVVETENLIEFGPPTNDPAKSNPTTYEDLIFADHSVLNFASKHEPAFSDPFHREDTHKNDVNTEKDFIMD